MRKRNQIYWVWSAMLGRCRNENDPGFKNYGGRGIAVCAEWHDFANFERDMGPRPAGGLLDRIDNDGPYSPENCRWSSRKEQNSNRRNCIYVSHEGEKVTLREYCRRQNLRYRPIVKRIQDRGWPIGLALRVPVGCGFRIDSKGGAYE